MERKPCPSDLSDSQWQIIELLIPPPKPGGRPRSVNIREVVNAIFHIRRRRLFSMGNRMNIYVFSGVK